MTDIVRDQDKMYVCELDGWNKHLSNINIGKRIQTWKQYVVFIVATLTE